MTISTPEKPQMACIVKQKDSSVLTLSLVMFILITQKCRTYAYAYLCRTPNREKLDTAVVQVISAILKGGQMQLKSIFAICSINVVSGYKWEYYFSLFKLWYGCYLYLDNDIITAHARLNFRCAFTNTDSELS